MRWFLYKDLAALLVNSYTHTHTHTMYGTDAFMPNAHKDIAPTAAVRDDQVMNVADWQVSPKQMVSQPQACMPAQTLWGLWVVGGRMWVGGWVHAAGLWPHITVNVMPPSQPWGPPAPPPPGPPPPPPPPPPPHTAPPRPPHPTPPPE